MDGKQAGQGILVSHPNSLKRLISCRFQRDGISFYQTIFADELPRGTVQETFVIKRKFSAHHAYSPSHSQFSLVEFSKGHCPDVTNMGIQTETMTDVAGDIEKWIGLKTATHLMS